jgi:4-hydroxy-3-methylbut-2-enyl diphosphate reductase
VLLPAFGVPPQVLERLRSTGCVVVDTTCGSVVYVWKSVERFAREGFTVVYHGRRGHEEAAATLSRLDRVSPSCDGRPRPYLILESLVEAHALRRLMLEPGGCGRGEDLPGGSASAGFEPMRDLVRIGFASQTTMLARETAEIEEALRDAQARRFGEERLSEHFRVQDTICGATQERQDAVEDLLDEPLDLVLVVGGRASSNSAHLAALASKRLSTFHVEGPEDVLSGDLLRHKVPGRPDATVTRGWLPPGHVVLGVTSGASTPEISVEAVIDRVSTVA